MNDADHADRRHLHLTEARAGRRSAGRVAAPARGAARRYEAVVVADAAAWTPAAENALSTVCAGGTVVAIVGAGTTPEVAERFREFDPGAGVLLIAAAGDRSCLVIDRSGTSRVERPGAHGDDGTVLPGIDQGAAQWVGTELWKRGVGLGDVVVVGKGHPVDNGWAVSDGNRAASAGGLGETLRDQRSRRRRRERPSAPTCPGWSLTADHFDPERIRVNGALFALADGIVGSSGAPLADHLGRYRWVVAGGVYVGEGPDTRLLTCPVTMQLPYRMSEPPHVRRVLDLRAGVLHEEVATPDGPLRSVRFSSLALPGTCVARVHCPDATKSAQLGRPADDEPLDQGVDGEVAWMRVAGSPGGVVAAAVDDRTRHGAGEVLDRFAAYVPSPDEIPSPAAAIARVRAAAGAGFDALLTEHRAAWAARWEDADIAVEGDDELQRLVRFALFHLIACAPDKGEAAVGARGLTGTAYRGHVFWDADTFTLPFLAATHPASARAMLEYRLRRLAPARATAQDLGRSGARFPWESAHSGWDVTPLSARDRTGKVVPIRTGQLEEHIVAQVAWAACCYIDWTGDTAFADGPGFDLLVETARYWASRVRYEADGAHIYGVIGPDEYHEPVDDNAFTNVMARWNLRRAWEAVMATPRRDITLAEADEWRAIADKLVDGFDPDTGIYEQCAGFHKLEPLIIAEVAPRRPITADLLLGGERVRGAQVIKQADVLMLHHLVPDAVEPDTLEPNLRFYEPRTAHGSSLSPGVHASLFARARDYERALDALRMASRIDFDDLTGTTGGGLHLATMGGVWQALAFGFAGLRPRGGRLSVDPRLPPAWAGLEVRVRFHARSVRVRLAHGEMTIVTDGPVPLTVEGTDFDVAGHLDLVRRGRVWKERK